MNRKFGKINASGGIDYAPSALNTPKGYTFNPSDEDYLAAGWKRISDHMPPSREGGYWTATGWTETEATIDRVYEWRENEPTPRRWTPLTIKRAAASQGIWGEFKEMLTANDAYEDFLMCQFVADNDPSFVELRKALAAKFGEDFVAQFLSGLEVE